MIYLTYDEYKNLGGICEETVFNRYIIRVCNIIDTATHNRITSDLMKDVTTVEFQTKYGHSTVEIPIDEITASVDVRIKSLCRDMVEYFSEHSEMSKTVSSESYSAGGVSQSISYQNTNSEESKDYINQMLYDYLSNITTSDGVSLLYKGMLY